MRLTITAEMLAALERAQDKPDWLHAEVARMRAAGEPYVLPLAAEQSTAPLTRRTTRNMWWWLFQ